MRSILAIVTLLLIGAQQEHPSFVPAAPPQVVEFVTRSDGWNYPQRDTDTIKLMETFKLDNTTNLYLDGIPVEGKQICIPCGDVIKRFKVNGKGKTFTVIEFTRPKNSKCIYTSTDFKLGGN
jgi:hypothetical protein